MEIAKFQTVLWEKEKEQEKEGGNFSPLLLEKALEAEISPIRAPSFIK